MGFRFQRRIRIAPGLSLNVSKSGLGVSVGPRGAKLSIGPRGMSHSIGLPGTGLHYREETRWGAGQRQSAPRIATGASEANLIVRDDGAVELVDAAGRPVAPAILKRFREQNAELIQRFLEGACEHWNAGIKAVLGVHRSTPHPDAPVTITAPPLDPLPYPFVPQPLGWLSRLWPPRRRRVEDANAAGARASAEAVAAWEEARDRANAEFRAREEDYTRARAGDVGAMERVLDERLTALAWPRSTEVSYQIREHGAAVWLDVDLPEVEELPTQHATPAARGLKLTIKRKSDTQIRREYMQHVHGVLFRLVGEVFAALPSVTDVVASGYSQRPDRATGQVRDDYLISTHIARATWRQMAFDKLEGLDVVECFTRFDARRTMTKTGIFTPITPHQGAEAESASVECRGS